MKKTGFRSANTPGDKRSKRGQNGVFLAPGGKFSQNSRKFPPGRPPPTAPGETLRIFRGEILGFSTVFWRIFPRKTGCFPRVASPQNRGELYPPEPPRKLLPTFLLFCRAFWGLKSGKRGVNGGVFGGNLVEISRNFPKSPEILPRAPPGAPRKNPPGI